MIGQPQAPTKPVFSSVEEARAALAADRLGAAYVRADQVYVVTAFGSGMFSRADWERGGAGAAGAGR